MIGIYECTLCKKIALSYRHIRANKFVCINCILLKCAYSKDQTTLFNDSDPDSEPCSNCLSYGFFDPIDCTDEFSNGLCYNCFDLWKESGSPLINNSINSKNYNETVKKLHDWDLEDWIKSWEI